MRVRCKGAFSWLTTSSTVTDGTSFWQTLQSRSVRSLCASITTEISVIIVRPKTARTFKVYCAISIVVCFFDYGVYLSSAHVLSHQLGHGGPQLLRRDLSIPVHVKLTRETHGGSHGGESDLRVWRDYGKRWTLTSLKASFSSFTPIIPAVSARSFGVIKSTKSSKSTLPPTWGKNQRKDAEMKTSVTLCWSYIFSIASWHFVLSIFYPESINFRHQFFCPFFTDFYQHRDSRFMLIFWLSSISSISVGM